MNILVGSMTSLVDHLVIDHEYSSISQFFYNRDFEYCVVFHYIDFI